MKKLTDRDRERIQEVLVREGHAKPTRITLKENILRYKANEPRFNANNGAWNHLRKILEVNFDGDPNTVEMGTQGDGDSVYVVIQLKPGKLFIEE